LIKWFFFSDENWSGFPDEKWLVYPVANSAISNLYPHIDLNYDPFHLVSWYQEKVINALRKAEYKRIKKEAEEAKEEGRKEDAAALMSEAKKIFDSRFFLMTSRTVLEARDKANKELNKENRERYKSLGIEPPSKLYERREKRTIRCCEER